MSATGAITGASVSAPTTISAGGNVTGANFVTGGVVTASGNVVGSILRSTGSYMVIPVGTSDPATATNGSIYMNVSGFSPVLRGYYNGIWSTL